MTQDVRRYLALTERAIAAAFINDSLHVHLLHGTQGPHTLNFALRLHHANKANLAKALKLGAAIEAAIGDGPVRVHGDRGTLYVEVPSPLPLIIHGDQLRGAGLAVPLGLDGRRAIIGIDFEDSPHVLLVGPTNAGKTTAARLLAYQLALQNPTRACRFIVSTFKPKDWTAFASVAHTFAVIVEPDESAQMVRYLVDVMHNRTKAGQDSPHIFVFLDDLLNLLGVAYTIGQHYALNAIALSPDGTKLAAVGYDQLLPLWPWGEPHGQAAHRALRGHQGIIPMVVFSPTGRLLASAGRDPAIQLWNANSGPWRDTLYGHTQDIYRVAFHPDEHLLASGSGAGTGRRWALRGSAQARSSPSEAPCYDHGGMIYALAFSPDGRLLVSAGVGPTLPLWDTTQAHRPALVAARKTVQEASEQVIVAVTFSPDGARLACGGTNLIQLWEPYSHAAPLLLRHPSDWVMALAFSRDGATLASASEDRTDGRSMGCTPGDAPRRTPRSPRGGHERGLQRRWDFCPERPRGWHDQNLGQR